MADPHSTDASRAGASHFDPDRDAKIDELLLAGLEHYFAGRFQESINVWGRVLFLDRGHTRARAYIERARSALAERQRKSEEMVHEGVAALQRGDGDAARELLESAAANGEAPDLALAYLDRLDRLTPGNEAARPQADAAQVPTRPARARAPRVLLRGSPRPVRVLPLIGIVVAGSAIILLATSFDLLKPLVDVSWGRPTAPAPVVVAPGPLPVPRTADLLLGRARALYGSGHLRDALTALDAIPPADPAFAESQRLRADIQRGLLEAAGLTPGGSAALKRGTPE